MTGKPTAEQAANELVRTEARYRVHGGRPSHRSALVSAAERLRKEGRTAQADEQHRMIFGDAVTLSLADAIAEIERRKNNPLTALEDAESAKRGE